MNLMAARFRTWWAGAVVVLVATLAGCGSGSGSGEDDTPAVCSSVDALRSSVAALTDVQVERGALDTFQKAFDQVRSNLSTVVKDAKREYADEVDTVEEAMSDIGKSLDAAVSAPTAANVAAVGAASQAVGTSIGALVDAVDSTC
jgi:hypothetical protein